VDVGEPAAGLAEEFGGARGLEEGLEQLPRMVELSGVTRLRDAHFELGGDEIDLFLLLIGEC
jgi:hypothetical protein